MYKQKETILKEARGEEIIELGWHMTKIIRRNSSGNWVILNFSWQKTLTLYQSILSPTLFKGYKSNNFKEKILMGARENRFQIS